MSNARRGGKLILSSSILKHQWFSSKQFAGPPVNVATTSFGFKDVEKEDKEGMVREVFMKVAPSYDLMNDIMSAGIHRIWKDRLVSKFGVFPGMTHLDVAGGTGDVGFRSLSALRAAETSARDGVFRVHDVTLAPGKVIISDVNPHMLVEGKRRAAQLDLINSPDWQGNRLATINFVEGNAENLPFDDCSVDMYTIVFGLRNVTDKLAALKDARRVLKPGGKFICMEFSRVRDESLRSFYEAYSFGVIPVMGELIAQDKWSYQYLVESIRRFPRRAELEEIMREAGFKCVAHEDLTGGVVAIHSGFRI